MQPICYVIQVFIRTVHKHTPQTRRKSSAQQSSGPAEEVFQEVNRCGCTRFTTQIFTVISLALFIALWCIGGFGFQRNSPGVASIFYLIGIVALVISCVGCNLLWCACCRPATGADE